VTIPWQGRRVAAAGVWTFAADYRADQSHPIEMAIIQPGERQRVGCGVNDGLGAHAVGIIDVIRDEQTRVRVNAHADLVTFLLPRHQNQIRQDFVAKNSVPPGGSIRPANPAFAFAIRLRVNGCFQFVDALKEFPALSRRQCLHLLQNFIRTHHSNHTTNGALRANSKPAFLPMTLAPPMAGDESASYSWKTTCISIKSLTVKNDPKRTRFGRKTGGPRFLKTILFRVFE
jgi:hypothetical protein